MNSRRKLTVEPLEARHLLAIVVNTLVDEADGSIDDGDISLRDAIHSAPSDGIIEFAAELSGTIFLDDKLGELRIDKPLTISGPGRELIVVDGRSGDYGPKFYGSSRVFSVDDGDDAIKSRVLLSGLTVANGYAGGSGKDGIGGVIRSSEDLTISQMYIEKGRAYEAGGGIWSDGELNIRNSRISDNFALSRVCNCNRSGGQAGGIYSSGPLTIVHSTISGNRGGTGGWGEYGDAGDGGKGGGIVSYGPLSIHSSTIAGNSAGDGGASGFGRDGGKGGDGGGIWAGGPASIVNSTVSGNSAGEGGTSIPAIGGDGGDGGGLFAAGELIIRHSTISGNSAGFVGLRYEGNIGRPGLGGGVFLAGPASDVRLDHSIVADNVAGIAEVITRTDIEGDITARFSFVSWADGATISDQGGNQLGLEQAIDPKLGPLSHNGGATTTHAPLQGSPVLNVGSADFAPGVDGGPELDQRGGTYRRVANGRVDIGAFEVQDSSVIGDFDQDGDVDGVDFLAWMVGYGRSDEHANLRSGDADGNGRVDGDDFLLWQDGYGGSIDPNVASALARTLSGWSASTGIRDRPSVTETATRDKAHLYSTAGLSAALESTQNAQFTLSSHMPGSSRRIAEPDVNGERRK